MFKGNKVSPDDPRRQRGGFLNEHPANKFQRGTYKGGKGLDTDAFHSLVEKHGGTSGSLGDFAVPHDNVDKFHSAAKGLGYMHKEHYDLGSSQHTEHTRPLAAVGLNRQANREGLARYAGKGHVIEVHPQTGRWVHYHKGATVSEGSDHRSLSDHIDEHFNGPDSQHSEQPTSQYSEHQALIRQPGRAEPAVSMRPAGPVQFGEKDYVQNDRYEPVEGHKVRVMYGEHKGKTGEVDHVAPSGHFAGVKKGNKFLGYYHASDLHVHKDHL